MQPTALSLVDWRRRTHEMYANVRHNLDHETTHERWRAARDEMFLHHDQSPLTDGDSIHDTGVPYWPYDPALRLETTMLPAEDPEPRTVEAGDGGELEMRLVGRVDLPDPVDGSYGGGRYLLDTAKGSWLGGEGDTISARIEAGEKL